MYGAIRLLREQLPHPPLTLLFTVQEEISSQGARYADLDYYGQPEMGFTWDGRDLAALAVAGKSKTNMEIEIFGKEAKFFGPQQGGISTPLIFARAVADLDTSGWLGKPVVKAGKQAASNITIIEGSAHGYATNVVMDRLLVRAEAREYDSPGFNREVAQAFRAAFERAAARTVNRAGAICQVALTDRAKMDNQYATLGAAGPEDFEMSEDIPCGSGRDAIVDEAGRIVFCGRTNGWPSETFWFHFNVEGKPGPRRFRFLSTRGNGAMAASAHIRYDAQSRERIPDTVLLPGRSGTAKKTGELHFCVDIKATTWQPGT